MFDVVISADREVHAVFNLYNNECILEGVFWRGKRIFQGRELFGQDYSVQFLYRICLILSAICLRELAKCKTTPLTTECACLMGTSETLQ
jgi:hypothetical protein